MKMKPFYEDNHIKIYNKDCRAMTELPDESVQMVCCSPPYWGLRRYSGEQELIWGDNHCEHQWDTPTSAILGFNTLFRPEGETSTPLGLPSDKGKYAETVKGGADRQQVKQVGSFCSLCGAWKGAYGLEPTPEMYIEHTIEILREIRRVLRKDGVVFWNIGDSYSATRWSNTPSTSFNPPAADIVLQKQTNLPPKNLCLIPFRLAIAAQEAGWWVRSVIIWSKPNPMPESVNDRPTESHEYILMLTKSGTSQYWTHRDHEGTRTQPKPDYRWIKRGKPDLKAIAKEIGGMSQRNVWEERDGEDRGWREASERQHSDIVEEVDIKPEGWTPKNKMGWDRINLWKGHDYYWDADAVREDYSPTVRWGGDKYKGAVKKGLEGEDAGLDRERSCFPGSGRNIRSVWEFPTQPYPEAHFAVFPEKLPELCIKAATPEAGCCSKCGAPWERIVEKHGSGPARKERKNTAIRLTRIAGQQWQDWKNEHPDETLGWQPTCKCNADKVPSIVLDPFMGAGTTLWVGKKLNRKAVGYEISEEYCQLAVDRCRQQVLGL